MSQKTENSLSHEQRYKRRQQMARDVQGGKSIDQVAREYRVGMNTVREACRENQVEFADRRFKQSSVTDERGARNDKEPAAA